MRWSFLKSRMGRRFLASLLILIALIVGLIGWFAYRSYDQSRLVQKIGELGGIVTIETVSPSERFSLATQLIPPQILDSVLTPFAKTKVTVRFGPVFQGLMAQSRLDPKFKPGVNFTDNELRQLVDYLSRLENLSALWLSGSHLSDEGLQPLSKLTSLEILILESVPITGEGLVHLAPLRQLRELDLAGTDLTNEMAANLALLVNLEDLDLAGTRISDEALQHLNGFTSLKTLGLFDTSVTTQGINRLRQSMPSLKVFH